MGKRILLMCIVLLTYILTTPIYAKKRSITVMTPFLAQPGTQLMVEAFEKAAQKKSWKVDVIDTSGDIAALVSRMEDVVLQKPDAIVINVDPSQIKTGLLAARDAGIPVFGMDSGVDPLLQSNVTSNGYVMAAETATYLVDQLNGRGNVVMFIFEPYPPVQMRGAIAEAIFNNSPDLKILDKITPSFDKGPLEGARNAMEAVLIANQGKESIQAVWAAWDDPAIGAEQAIRDAGRENENIIIVGIDATEQAKDRISAGGNFKATVAQDFTLIAETVAQTVEQYLNTGSVSQKQIYVSAKLITADSLK
ncbi:MAG: substrate-binding domain-containing protein [SAR324 cluster bacterium]|nr:substrate-binding domain-containing protein [SAR324 cluster bacterium]